MQDIKEWVEYREREKAIANTRICFEVRANTLRPRLHSSEGFPLWFDPAISPTLHVPIRAIRPASPLIRRLTYNHEPASSFEDTTSTTLEYEKWSDLS